MPIKTSECYGLPNDYMLDCMGKPTPCVWNGEVHVKRYRISVEEVVEPADVLKARLQALLKERGHPDNDRAIRQEASRLGISLD